MKPTKNPWVIEKTKSTFERECSLSQIPYVIREDGSKGCIWCGDDLKTKHHAQRYCKDKDCPKSAYIWGYPQKDEGLSELLNSQNFKCNICQFDYKPELIKLSSNFITCDANLARQLKLSIDLKLRPEVDHIQAITTGGQSLGLSNHQAICYTCHKSKTKNDVKLNKRVKSPEEIQKLKDKKIEKGYYEKLGPFIQQYYRDPKNGEDRGTVWDENFQNFKDVFIGEWLTIEELGYLIRCRDYGDHQRLKEKEWAEAELEKRLKAKPGPLPSDPTAK